MFASSFTSYKRYSCMITSLPLSNSFPTHVEYRIQSVACSKADTKIHELVCQLHMRFLRFLQWQPRVTWPRTSLQIEEKYASNSPKQAALGRSCRFFPISLHFERCWAAIDGHAANFAVISPHAAIAQFQSLGRDGGRQDRVPGTC